MKSPKATANPDAAPREIPRAAAGGLPTDLYAIVHPVARGKPMSRTYKMKGVQYSGFHCCFCCALSRRVAQCRAVSRSVAQRLLFILYLGM